MRVLGKWWEQMGELDSLGRTVRRRLTAQDLGKDSVPGVMGYAKAYFWVFVDPRVMIMFFQYGACFGTELTMYNQLPRPREQLLKMPTRVGYSIVRY